MHPLVASLTPGTPVREALKVAQAVGIEVRGKHANSEIVLSIPGQPMEVINHARRDLGKATLCRIKKWAQILAGKEETMEQQPPEGLSAGSLTERIYQYIAQHPGADSAAIYHYLAKKHGTTSSSASGLLSALYKRGGFIERRTEEGGYRYYPAGFLAKIADAEQVAEKLAAEAERQEAAEAKKAASEAEKAPMPAAVPAAVAPPAELPQLLAEIQAALAPLAGLAEKVTTLLAGVEAMTARQAEVLKADQNLVDAISLLGQQLEEFAKARG